jgi:hypothetical protein
MENVKLIESPTPQGDVVIYAIIDRGNGEYTSMLKSTYDEMLAQQEAAQPLL